MNELALGLALQLTFVVGPLVLFYAIGRSLEKKHFASIREREAQLLHLPAVTFSTIPEQWAHLSPSLVSGNVVISLDYFKRFVAGLRNLLGGRIGAYETLLDRARREALLRMKRQAQLRGAKAIVNVRLETSRLANASAGGKGTAGVEILAFGTALLER
jgi:uncharacterized protein YbjQ (UPF0145 family)